MDIIKYINETQNVTLTKSQKKGVEAKGNTALVAVPGAGKTAVFVIRIAKLIYEDNISPKNILALTFSKAATIDMQRRYENWFKDLEDVLEEDQSPSFYTIHGFCLSVLRNNLPEFYKYGIIEGDCGVKSKTLRACYHECTDEYIDEDTLTELETNIGFCKNFMISPSEHHCEIPCFAEIFDLYEKKKKENDWLDFDDMLIMTAELFKENASVVNKYKENIKYIMIDEYQDTSKLQNEIITALVGGDTELFVVGDDDQSIYKFRGASPELFLSFEKNFGGQVIYMEDNFRSTKEITNLASEFIKANKNRYEKTIKSRGNKGKKVTINTYKTSEDQTKSIVEEVQKSKAKTKAILYRNNFSAIPYLYYLSKENVSFYMRNGETVFSSPLISDILAYFELILGDYTAFEKLSSKYYVAANITNKLKCNTFDSVSDYFRALVLELEKQKKNPFLISKIRDLHYYISIYNEETDPSVVLNFILKKSGYLEYLAKNNGEDSLFVLSAKQAIAMFIDIAENCSTVKDFYENINNLKKTFAQNNEQNRRKASIVLSTIHSAKGLEWDEVWLIDIMDKVFPTSQATASMELLEEERRLFYVGMTRAKTKLSISYPEKTNYGNSSSMFIRAILEKEENLKKETSTPETKTKDKTEFIIEKGCLYKNKNSKETIKVLSIDKESDYVFAEVLNSKDDICKKFSYSRFSDFFIPTVQPQ